MAKVLLNSNKTNQNKTLKPTFTKLSNLNAVILTSEELITVQYDLDQ